MPTPQTGMDKAFWKEWDKDHDIMRRCDMLMKIDRLSYDHTVNWIENARADSFSIGQSHGEDILDASKLSVEEARIRFTNPNQAIRLTMKTLAELIGNAEKEIFDKAIRDMCKHEDGNGNHYHPREYCDKEIENIIHKTYLTGFEAGKKAWYEETKFIPIDPALEVIKKGGIKNPDLKFGVFKKWHG